MALLAHRLERAGFRTANLDYPSTEKPIAELVDHLQRELGACCAEATRLHFVTHSMGGVLVRAWIAREGPQRVARVVMLAPPNGGSEIVDHLRETPLLEWALGPAVLELGDRRGEHTAAAARERGRLRARRDRRHPGTLNPIGSWMIAGPDDGTVSVESARLEGLERRGCLRRDAGHAHLHHGLVGGCRRGRALPAAWALLGGGARAGRQLSLAGYSRAAGVSPSEASQGLSMMTQGRSRREFRSGEAQAGPRSRAAR